MAVKCFWTKPSGRKRVYLRRYVYSSSAKCPGKFGYHNAEYFLGIFTEHRTEKGYVRAFENEHPEALIPHDDPRWPTKCSQCPYLFTPDNPWQYFTDSVYVDEAGNEYSLRYPTPGMMWDAWWMGNRQKGPDGIHLMVACPNGHPWCVDGRASNCTSPCKNCGKPYYMHNTKDFPCKEYIDAKPHKCWVRHGTPPKVTVDKSGNTCSAGARSILTPGYHGFLQDGMLTEPLPQPR